MKGSFSQMLMAWFSPLLGDLLIFYAKKISRQQKAHPASLSSAVAADPLRAAQPARALRNSLRSNSPRAIPVLPAPCSAALRGKGLGSKRVSMTLTLLARRYLSNRENYTVGLSELL